MFTSSVTDPRKRWAPSSIRVRRNTKSYGHRQEEILREGLRSNNRFYVYHDRNIDEIHKLDAVVYQRDRRHLPPVGLQFTTKHDSEKEERTFASIRRNGVVTRFLYLVAESELNDTAWRIVHKLVRDTACQPERRALTLAVLAVDELGEFYLRSTRTVGSVTGAENRICPKTRRKQ